MRRQRDMNAQDMVETLRSSGIKGAGGIPTEGRPRMKEGIEHLTYGVLGSRVP